MLSAHLDTVFPASTPLQPVLDGDTLHSPGACDNAAGIIGMLAIAHAVVEAKLTVPAPIIFLANVGEEGEGNLRGVRHLYHSDALASRIAAHIVLDGAGTDEAVTQALGSRRLSIHIKGPGGHSFSDFGRPNPILALAAAIETIGRIHLPEEPRSTLTVGTIEGGTSVNSIPQFARAAVDLRSTSPQQLVRLEVEVNRAVEEAVSAHNIEQITKPSYNADRDQITFTIEKIGDRPAGRLPLDSPLLEALRAVDRHLGLKNQPAPRLNQRQYSALHRRAIAFAGCRRRRRRCAHHSRVVLRAWPRTRAEAHSFAALVDDRLGGDSVILLISRRRMCQHPYMRRIYLFALAALLLPAALFSQAPKYAGPDLVYINAWIYTGEGLWTNRPHVANAIAIKDGKVLAVGSNAEIQKLVDAHTVVRDL